MVKLKIGNKVEFNSMAPAYLLKRFGNRPNTIKRINRNVWIVLKKDRKSSKTKIHLVWLNLVKKHRSKRR